MAEIIKHINDTNASYRTLTAGDAKNTDLFFDQDQYSFFGGANRVIKVRLHKTNLSQAVLFIASILPRKYDLGAKHYKVYYTPNFVSENLAIIDAFFTIDGVNVEERIVEWNVRKDVQQKNGKIDNRLYLNGIQFDLPYTFNGSPLINKFSIRNYLAGGYSDVRMVSNADDIYDLYISNTTEAYVVDDGIMDDMDKHSDESIESLQQIYYGAPGTGKSHTIDGIVNKDNSIRTTFHPDSDYSTFVGCYKPKAKEGAENEITYGFVPQAFTTAYVEAWKDTTKPYYLVIEEINRGNCAQIFGDIFQLLDRKEDGMSSYEIKPDTDLEQYLCKVFENENIDDEKIKSGKVMRIPANLFILATMNTSDQSLFPIDSAFKRRWDWKYIPIKDEGKNFKIVVGEAQYDWWKFVSVVNERIEEVTDSEDKQIGYWFAKANGKNEISAEAMVSKVLFYLWNDVFKDYAHSSNSLFHIENRKYKFRDFYHTDGNVNIVVLKEFLDGLKLENEKMIKQEPQASEE